MPGTADNFVVAMMEDFASIIRRCCAALRAFAERRPSMRANVQHRVNIIANSEESHGKAAYLHDPRCASGDLISTANEGFLRHDAPHAALVLAGEGMRL